MENTERQDSLEEFFNRQFAVSLVVFGKTAERVYRDAQGQGVISGPILHSCENFKEAIKNGIRAQLVMEIKRKEGPADTYHLGDRVKVTPDETVLPAIQPKEKPRR